MKRIVPVFLVVTVMIAALFLGTKMRHAGRERQSMREDYVPQLIETGKQSAAASAAMPPPERADEVVLNFPQLPLDAGALAWEQQIEAISNRPDVPDVLKARLLIQMLPGIPEEALAQAAESAAGFLADKDYEAIALPAMLNPQTHGRAMSVLFADLMERPDSIALPALLTIACDPAHAFAPAALDNLQLLLGKDFGSEWAKWDAEIRRRLQRQPR